MLGVGNPIMGDDGVGVYIARAIKDKLRSETNVQVKELGVGGLKLVEELLDHDEVYIVDSHSSFEAEPGRVREFRPEQFEDTLHPSSPHGTNLATALRLYREMEPNRIPRKIRIFTIDISQDFTFREGMSEPVREAASKLTESLVREIQHRPTRE